jgi:hypothetical protein
MGASEYTCKQIALLTQLSSCIAEVGESLGENSSTWLNLKEFQNNLKWYLAHRVLDEVQ